MNTNRENENKTQELTEHQVGGGQIISKIYTAVVIQWANPIIEIYSVNKAESGPMSTS